MLSGRHTVIRFAAAKPRKNAYSVPKEWSDAPELRCELRRV
jgi:hypothetical protein